MTNGIGDIIYDAYKGATGKNTNRAEINSWVNSLQYMDRVLAHPAIPADAGVAIEYHIPRSNKRIDFILTGADAQNQETAILVELKQWQHATLTDQDAIVLTQFKGGLQATPHPSYQVWSYKRLLEDYNQTVQEEHIRLYPCAYLHNYAQDDVLANKFYGEYTRQAPVFYKADAVKQTPHRIEQGRIRPSKNLADSLAGMLRGNQEFVMIDDQKVVYETALAQAAKASAGVKHVLIVEGGPGTGKTVVAVNLLVSLTKRELVAQYVTRNSAPRLVYEAKLTGSLKKSRITNLFSGSGAYHAAQPNTYDCLIVDEAHRLNAKSGMFSHLGENQVGELIRAAKFSVFFVDEDQKVTLKDIGDKEEIRRWARRHNAAITELKLESQFRCNGSDGYLAWLDNTLGIAPTANPTLDPREYDFRIMESPAALHALIREKNKPGNKARMVAGYCWKWISKKAPALKDIVLPGYQATWNLDVDGQAWIIKPDSVSEVGCIHTCQGLELDYVGVIVGPDLVVRDGAVVTVPEARASGDKSVHGWKALVKKDPAAAKARLDAIIKNTYRILMTRGLKGCYVHFTDKETADYFKARIAAQPAPAAASSVAAVAAKLKKLFTLEPDVAAALKYVDYLPVFSLEAACGNFGRGMAVEPQGWIKCPPGVKPDHNMFAAKVAGRSMEPKLEDGDYCVFRANVGGTRNNKLVLVQHSSIADPDTGGSYTVIPNSACGITREAGGGPSAMRARPGGVYATRRAPAMRAENFIRSFLAKKYTSKKKYAQDGTWQHEEIILKPLNPEYRDILIPNAEDEEFMVVAEVVGKCLWY